jgi:hypothetical protein
MVADNFLCITAVALFWFTDLRARLGHAQTANHRARYPPDRISRPHMGRECVGPAFTVRLRWPIGSTFTQLFVRADMFEQRVVIWIGLLEMPLIPKPFSLLWSLVFP